MVGTGHFGRYHVNKYAELPASQLVAICDANRDHCQAMAAERGVEAIFDYRDLPGKVDAVSIAVPSSLHYEVGRYLLEHGIHVMMEKPITDTPETARELIRIARENNLVLQVGHLERFRSARLALEKVLKDPLYIESTRITPFQPRVADVSVILDLMIHDIDMILSMVDSPVVHVDAIGAPVLTGHEDIANTRLRFENGCVATVTASRIAMKQERKLRIFQPDAYISVDMAANKMAIARKKPGEGLAGFPNVEFENQEFQGDDPLKSQIESFLDCIANGKEPLVNGEAGLRALETAIDITTKLREHLALVSSRLV